MILFSHPTSPDNDKETFIQDFQAIALPQFAFGSQIRNANTSVSQMFPISQYDEEIMFGRENSKIDTSKFMFGKPNSSQSKLLIEEEDLESDFEI